MEKKKAKAKTKISSQTQLETQASNQFHVNSPLLFERKNYMLMALGLLVIFLGYLLMMGKNNDIQSLDAVFPADDVYSFRRIVLAPAVIISGFLIELYSILKIKKSSK